MTKVKPTPGEIEQLSQSSISKDIISKRNHSNIDENYVVTGMQERKYCILCRQPKCTRWTCKCMSHHKITCVLNVHYLEI